MLGLLNEHVREDPVVHRVGVFGHIPLARTDDGIRGFAGAVINCLMSCFCMIALAANWQRI